MENGKCVGGDFICLNDVHELLKLFYIFQILLHYRFRIIIYRLQFSWEILKYIS